MPRASPSRKKSSSCDDSSRTIRDSRSRTRPGSDRCARTYRPQSRTRRPHHRFHRVNEGLPRLTLLGQLPAPFRGEPVKTSPPLARLLDPAALDPPPVFKAEERRVECGEREGQPPPRSCLDQFADLVAVPGASLEQREDEHLATAFLQFRAEHYNKAPYM